MPQYQPSIEFFNPIVNGWIGKIREAERLKKPFDDVAMQCMAFFSSAVGFMWEPEFQKKFFKGKLSPRFKITIAKAFELVALFGPSLYWKNPERVVRPRKSIQFDPQLFGFDQQAAMIYQFTLQQQGTTSAVRSAQAELLKAYLNYTPDEQPGGLALHSESAITEALIKGRGCLWCEPFRMPGSSRTLTGCFFDSVDNLLIDPDAESLQDAMWIAKRCSEPHWVLEQRYGWPKDSLKHAARLESANAFGASQADDMSTLRRNEGISSDHVPYWKVWSKMGVGSRLTGVDTLIADSLDSVIGDFAYLVVAEGVPSPLNAPSREIYQNKLPDEEVQRMFRWPVPFWTDDRWPVATLDFYNKPRCPWPIAPLSPGLGELVFLNVMVSHLCNRIWSSSRDFIAVLKRFQKEVEDKLQNGEDLCIIPVSEMNKDLDTCIKWLQQPQVNKDVWAIIDAVMDLFNRRVGLNELLYGLTPGGTQSRTATDVQTKREMVSIRPDYMAAKVEKWQEEVAVMEKFTARWFVRGQDLRGMFGPTETYLWDKYIYGTDPEEVVREMDVTIAAGSSRKRNRERDVENINSVLHVVFPELSKHADVTGDTQPVNNLTKMWGEALDLDTQGLMMGPRQQQVSPEQQQAMQQQMQLENDKLQAEVQTKQMDARIKMVELEIKRLEAEMGGVDLESERQMKMLELGSDHAMKSQELDFEREKQGMELQHEHEKGRLDLLLAEAQARQKIQQGRVLGEQKVRQGEELGEQKVKQAKAMAKAKPKPAASRNGSK